MRQRNQDLRTGSLLAWFDRSQRTRNASILFLVSGAEDISALHGIEAACGDLLGDGYQWLTVADHLDLAAVDPCLNPENMVRLEAAELANLMPDELSKALAPALQSLRGGRRPIFPNAAGAVGAVAEGVNFLNRERDIAELRSRLVNGQSVLLVAPRRCGKTSLLKRMERELAGSLPSFFLDLEGHNSVEGVTARFLQLARRGPFGLAKREVSRFGWSQILKEAIAQLASSGPVLFLLDELVYFLENLRPPETIEMFLRELGAACQHKNVRLLIAGFRDLDDFVREHLRRGREELPALFCQLGRYVLPPLAESCLNAELRRVLIGTDLVPSERDMEWLRGKIDLAMPFPALRFISDLASRVHASGPIDVKEIEETYQEFLSITDAFNELDQYLEKKGRQIAGAETLLGDILTRIACDEDGMDATDAAALLESKGGGQLMDWLLEIFPLRLTDKGRLVVASRIFRRWWLKREGIS